MPPGVLWVANSAHYCRSSSGGGTSIYLVKSWIQDPVDAKILAILLVDGHRGWPSRDHRLLRLNVVGSNPLRFASLEQDIPCADANRSIARHTSACVMIRFPPVVFVRIQKRFYSTYNFLQQATFPRNLLIFQHFLNKNLGFSP